MANQIDSLQGEKIPHYEIAIVGGGIAGLYCLYRLLKSGYKKKEIKLYESCDHLGGRIETWSIQRVRDDDINPVGFVQEKDPRHYLTDPPDKTKPYSISPEESEYFRAEFGPMRIEPRDQPFLQKLLDELGIKEPEPKEKESWDNLVPFPSYASEELQSPKFTLKGEEEEQSTPMDLLLLGIRRILDLIENPELYNGMWKNTEAKKVWIKLVSPKLLHRPYWKSELLEWINQLEDSKEGNNPDDSKSDYQTIREYFQFNEYHLWDLGFWNLLSDVLSHYAVVKIRDWGTYYHLLHENLNAAEWMIFWLKAIKGTHSLRGIRGGMTLLIYRLMEKIANIGGEPGQDTLKNRLARLINTGHELDKLSLVDVGIALHLTKKERHGREVKKTKKSATANHVILALPKWPLDKLNLPELFEDKEKREDNKKSNLENNKKKIEDALGSVKCLPLLKCFFILENPWWEDDCPLNRHASDVPTRELSYHKSNDKTKGMLMFYTDHPAISFWSDYLREFESSGPNSQEHCKIWWRDAEACPLWDDSKKEWKTGLPDEVMRILNEIKDQESINHTNPSEWTPSFRQKFSEDRPPVTQKILENSQKILEALDDSAGDYKKSFQEWVLKINEFKLQKKQQKRLWDRFVQFMRDYNHHDFSPDRLLACGIRDWGKEPFGAAAHGWLPGEKSWDHIDYLAAFPTVENDDTTIKDQWKKRIHICGEAYSDYQGFIEGSLRSVWKTIQKLPKPD